MVRLPQSSSIFNAATNASGGISTFPNCLIRFLPVFAASTLPPLASRRFPTYIRAMTPEAVIATLRANEAALRLKGVAHAALFGSVARGEAGPDSDIDIMVEIDPAAPVGVWEYVGITHFIGDLFPVKVDVSERQALKVHVRPSAERDAIHAF